MLGIIIAKIFFRYVPSEKVRSVKSLYSTWFWHVAEYSGTVLVSPEKMRVSKKWTINEILS